MLPPPETSNVRGWAGSTGTTGGVKLSPADPSLGDPPCPPHSRQKAPGPSRSWEEWCPEDLILEQTLGGRCTAGPGPCWGHREVTKRSPLACKSGGAPGPWRPQACLASHLSQRWLGDASGDWDGGVWHLAPSGLLVCPRGPWGSKGDGTRREQGRAGSSRCNNGPKEAEAPLVVPVLVLAGRDAAVTGTLLREILGHPGKPRQHLPGQPVRLNSPAQS